MKQKSVQIQYGEVLIWKEFDQHDDGVTVKDAWFIYLGYNSNQGIHYLIRTTTKFQHYSKFQSRENHSIISFDPEKNKHHSFFEKKCLVDCSGKTFDLNISIAKLLSDGKAEVKGRLHNNDIKDIFLKLLQNKVIERKVLMEIRSCLNSAGVYGLPEVSSRKKT